MDFTLKTYQQLLETLIEKNYHFLIVEEYFNHQVALLQSRSIAKSLPRPLVLLRHDVDRKPQNALRMAKLENKLGIKTSYYFRIVPESYDENIIKQIADLGHEIGYHYENLSQAEILIKNLKLKIKNSKKHKEKVFEIALNDFEQNLKKFRQLYPVKTICMHGSPLSKWDNRKLWDKYNYKDYGIIAEPYFDIDFDKIQYITDAGRSWDNAKTNFRDKVDSPFGDNFKHTNDIIVALNESKLSNQIMLNIHPEHWTNSKFEWWKIWMIRKAKNTVKRVIIRSQRSEI